VRVNGVHATTSDDFTTWQATVPLAAGKNKLVVETEDSDGDINTMADIIWVRQAKALKPNPLAIDYVNGSNELMVAGNITNALFRVDLITGERGLITGQASGSGPEIGNLLISYCLPTEKRAMSPMSRITLLSVSI